jgi:PRTRC genetic system protein F
MLALPSLARVPRAYTILGDMAATAATAAALLDAGILSPRTPGRTPADVLRHGLRQWLDRQLDGCQRIRVGVEYYEAGALHRWTGAPTTAGSLILRCVAIPHVFVGEALERLPEPAARVVMQALGAASSAGLQMLLPADVLEFARFCHWQGEDDERAIVAEYTAQGETYEGPTRAHLDAYVPAWAVAPHARNIPAWQVPMTLQPAVEAVYAAIPAARKARLARPDYEEVDGAFCLWIRWKREPGKDDEALADARIVDDYYEEMAQSVGVSDCFADVEVHTPADVVTRLRAWEPVFTLARAVEALLRAAGVRDGH